MWIIRNTHYPHPTIDEDQLPVLELSRNLLPNQGRFRPIQEHRIGTPIRTHANKPIDISVSIYHTKFFKIQLFSPKPTAQRATTLTSDSNRTSSSSSCPACPSRSPVSLPCSVCPTRRPQSASATSASAAASRPCSRAATAARLVDWAAARVAWAGSAGRWAAPTTSTRNADDRRWAGAARACGSAATWLGCCATGPAARAAGAASGGPTCSRPGRLSAPIAACRASRDL